MWSLLASVFLATAAPEPLTLDALLARPLSPGVAYLLFAHGSDARARGRLAEGLADPRPEVRAACARGIYVVGAREHAVVLAKALAGEQDRSAAREMIRALVWAGGPAEAEQALAAAKRLGSPLPWDWSSALALAYGVDAVPALLERRSDLRLSRGSLRTLLLEATRRKPEALEAAASRALGGADPEAWASVQLALLETGQPPSADLLRTALASRSPAVLAETVWYVLAARAAGHGPEPSLALPAAAPTGLDDPDLAFAFELARRSTGARSVTDAGWARHVAEGGDSRLFALSQSAPPAAAWVMKSLTREERAALKQARPHLLENAERAGPVEPHEPSAKGALLLRTAAGHPPGVIEDLLAQGACTLGRDPLFAVGEIQRHPDLRVKRLAVMATVRPAACREVATALLLGFEPQPGEPASDPEAAVVVVHPDAPACSELDARATWPAGSGAIQEPRKRRHRDPGYPRRARDERIDGTVVVEGIVGRTGCMHSVRVRRPVHPLLDAEALLAVSAWTYTPALLDGVPVPFEMVVTVNFRRR